MTPASTPLAALRRTAAHSPPAGDEHFPPPPTADPAPQAPGPVAPEYSTGSPLAALRRTAAHSDPAGGEDFPPPPTGDPAPQAPDPVAPEHSTGSPLAALRRTAAHSAPAGGEHFPPPPAGDSAPQAPGPDAPAYPTGSPLTALRRTAAHPNPGDGAQLSSPSSEADPAPQDSVLGDLLAPFDRVRLPRPAVSLDDDADASQSPPPPPASARFPDTPPPVADPGPSTAAPSRGDVPDVESAPGGAEFRLLPPMPVTPPPPGPAAATEADPAPLPGLAPPPWSASASTSASAPAEPTDKVIPKPTASPRTTAARRAVGAVDLTPGPGAGRPFVAFARPALYDDSTTRLRPVRTWAQPRVTAAAACVVLGLGLIGGAATGSLLTGGTEGVSATRNAYAVAGELWHSVPVDQLFPATIKGEGAGPGGADRAWTRVAVAPDSTCKDAFDPLLRKALAPAGCLRLLRATYTDATRSHVTTVGLLFTKADAEAMRSLRTRFTEEGLDRRPDLMPRPYAAKGTPAADFGDAQRASWTVSVLPDAPVVAFAVSGFADGRAVTEPEPADEAMKSSDTTAPAQAGLGNEAKGIADRVERRLRKTLAATEKSS
ncbi:hypothetical protein [Streptomyces sp. NPDC057302]|uniref:hypothetical protein n=1 Tax=Streptomyces sp. NPDC057302 TaxID=3346094 RepID=UPI0036305AA6